MDILDLSPKGKKRFVTWMSKRHRELCISELVRNAPDERGLFRMCRYIDRWYDEHEPYMKPIKASMKPSEVQQGSGDAEDGLTPETFRTIVPEAPKHTRLKQHNFSRRVSARLNVFITQYPEAHISKMIAEAVDEADLMKAMDDFEKRKVQLDPCVKMWCVRAL